MAADPGLSPLAQARRDALLPELLRELRARSRRRRVRRTAVAALLAVIPVLAWQLAPGAAPPAPMVVDAGPGPGPRYELVDDDPSILARCAVAAHAHGEWWLTDAELHDALAAAGRTAGLVRVGGRVLVSADAVDPFPARASGISP